MTNTMKKQKKNAFIQCPYKHPTMFQPCPLFSDYDQKQENAHKTVWSMIKVTSLQRETLIRIVLTPERLVVWGCSFCENISAVKDSGSRAYVLP